MTNSSIYIMWNHEKCRTLKIKLWNSSKLSLKIFLKSNLAELQISKFRDLLELLNNIDLFNQNLFSHQTIFLRNFVQMTLSKKMSNLLNYKANRQSLIKMSFHLVTLYHKHQTKSNLSCKNKSQSTTIRTTWVLQLLTLLQDRQSLSIKTKEKKFQSFSKCSCFPRPQRYTEIQKEYTSQEEWSLWIDLSS